MPTISATPNPAKPNDLLTFVGKDWDRKPVRTYLDGVLVADLTASRDREFTCGWTAAATPKTQTIVCKQVRSGKWTEVARGSVVVAALAFINVLVIRSPDGRSAAVSWNTPVLSTGYVEFGPTTAYGSETGRQTTPDYGTTVKHQQLLTGLTPGVPVHLRIRGGTVANTYDSASADRTV